MSVKLPIIYSAHHASHEFGVYHNRVNLTLEQQLRYSDYGTAETVPTNGVATVVAEYSRGLVDLNRAPSDSSLFPKKDFGKPKKNNIWKPGKEVTEEEKKKIFKEIYLPFHDKIMSLIKTLDKPGFVIAWDNTAHHVIGKDTFGKYQEMKPIILSNCGAEGTTESDPRIGEPTTCDPKFLLDFGKQFKKTLAKYSLSNEIYYNLVFKGGYITQHYNTYRNPKLHPSQPIQSFQVEYDTTITHDQKTLQPNPKAMAGLKNAFEEAIYQTYISNY